MSLLKMKKKNPPDSDGSSEQSLHSAEDLKKIQEQLTGIERKLDQLALSVSELKNRPRGEGRPHSGGGFRPRHGGFGGHRKDRFNQGHRGGGGSHQGHQGHPGSHPGGHQGPRNFHDRGHHNPRPHNPRPFGNQSPDNFGNQQQGPRPSFKVNRPEDIP